MVGTVQDSQEAEARRRIKYEKGWPQDALQAVEAQLRRMKTSESEEELKTGTDDRCDARKKRIHVDLPPEQSALPYNWEQFLDMNTGEVYYIDWTTCKRTCRDPREAARLAENKIRALREDYLLNTSREQASSHSLTSTSFDTSSSSSSETLPTLPSGEGLEEQEQHQCQELEGSDESEEQQQQQQEVSSNDQVMVTGCRRCLTYWLVERHRPVCPSCGSHLQVMN